MLPFPTSCPSVLTLQAFVPPCVISVVTQSYSQKSQAAAAENVLHARASLLICLTLIVFEKQVDTYTAFSSSIPVLLCLKMILHSNLDSLNCKGAVLENTRVGSLCFSDVSTKTMMFLPCLPCLETKLVELEFYCKLDGL